MRNKRKFIFILIILLGIGFAAVSTSLIINGVVGIAGNPNDFDVIFTEAVINGKGSNVVIDETKEK